MVNDKMFKAKKKKQAPVPQEKLKTALASMSKPTHPKKGDVSNHKADVAMPASASNVPPVEIQFAQKLACNDPVMRNRAVKKLKKWLQAHSSESTDDLIFTEVEMMRLWKGLYYCYWMSDKPLVQEELSESIGSMVNSFGNNESAALLFAAAFMATMGREWVGIDRWRMDKFMMLVRRFLRQCFVFLARFGWNKTSVKNWAQLCEKQVVSANSLNSTSGGKKKKKKKEDFEEASDDHEQQLPSVQQTHNVALGFQLHFVDIYLEELAKIGGEDLPAETIQILLRPFIAELARGDDVRLNDHIEERIFHHLMRQSDVGIAYEEGLDGGDDEDDEMEGDDDDEGKMENGDDDSDIDEDNMNDDVKDPRAGKVDVVLPQLLPDYAKLAEALFEAGGAKDVSSQGRTRLFKLTKEFRALADGSYPLAIDLSEDEADLPKLNVKKAAKKALHEELRRQEELREEREKFRASLKEQQKKAKATTAEPLEVKTLEDKSDEDEEDGDDEEELVSPPKKKKLMAKAEPHMNGRSPSLGKKDKKLTKKIETSKKFENIETEKSHKDKKDKKQKKKIEVEPASPKSLDASNSAMSDAASPSKQKKKKKKNKKNKSNGSPTSPLILSLTPEQEQKKARKNSAEQTEVSVKPAQSSSPTSGLMLNVTTESTKLKKSKKLTSLDDSTASETVITLSSKKRKHMDQKSVTPMHKKLVANEFITNSLPTKAGLKKKRINFSLMENKCSSLQDIDKSIQESPDIPFNADVKPKAGVLKKSSTSSSSSVPNTPPSGTKADKQSVAYNTLLNGRSSFMKRRARASDFF